MECLTFQPSILSAPLSNLRGFNLLAEGLLVDKVDNLELRGSQRLILKRRFLYQQIARPAAMRWPPE